MRLVVDCSVAMKWVIEEPGSDIALRVLASSDELLLPDFWLAEATSVLWKNHKRGTITAARAADGLKLLAAMPTTTTTDMRLHAFALQVSMDTGQSPYDTLYLAFAMVTNADRLIVSDAPFLKAMQPSFSYMMMSLKDWSAAESPTEV